MENRLNRRRLLQWLGIGAATSATTAAATIRAPAAPPPPSALARDPVRLLFTRVNGERHYDAALRFDTLAVGDVVALRREPDNAHDRRAIEVFDAHEHKLGYVTRGDNSAVARMMDAGERFEARVARLTPPLDIRVEVHWLRG